MAEHAAGRQQILLLLVLTAVAGWLDALSYLRLGRVFTSFMSGNVIVAGLALAQRDRQLLAGAAVALAAAGLGAAIGAAAIPRRRSHRFWGVAITRALGLELILLVALAIAWQAVGGPETGSGAILWLVALAACAMGIQGVAVHALGVHGMQTIAVTSTFNLLGSRLARPHGEPDPAGVPSWALTASIAAYVLSALAVATTRNQAFAHLVPASALAIVLIVGRAYRAH